ncbi:MAG: O-antigen ligase [Pontiella sp.]
MRSGQSSVLGLQSSAILFGLAICSFLFYGVVGQDKTWLLAPVYLFSYALISIALLRKSYQLLAISHQPKSSPQTSNSKLPTTAILWMLFLIYGIAMIQTAAVPFEAKLVTLFIGGVVGAYLVWGVELTAFKDNRIVLGTLIFVVMLAALYGLIIHFKCPDQVLWTERYAMYDGRLMSTYICPNHFAHLMQMLLPFCLVLLFIPQSGIYLRVLSAYSFLVFLPPLYLTESRAGWLGAIAAVGITICLMALRRSKKLFVLLMILVPLCSILLLLGGWRYSETFQRRMAPVVEFLQGQAEDGVGSEARDFRPQTWMDTIDMIKAAPLFGHGPGNYRYTYPEYRNRFKGQRIVTGHPHNEVLELMADYGLIGFGLFALAWIYGLVWVLVKSLRAREIRHAYLGFAFLGTAAGTMVHSFFDFQMHVYPNALVFALLAAVVVGPLRAAKRRGQGARGEAALECGDSSSLSPERDSLSRAREQRSDDRGQESGIRHEVGLERRDGNEAATQQLKHEQSAVRSELTVKDETEFILPDGKLSTPKAQRQMPAILLSWLLAVGYLLLAILSLQVMGSSFIRALGDRAAGQALGIRQLAVGSKRSAENFYILAVKIDSQNWRAYKGMGNLLYEHRYHCLDRIEKVQLAEQEREWFENAYAHNPKDPEIISALGKCLIFLSRAEDAPKDGGFARQRTEGGDQQRTEVGGQRIEISNLSESPQLTAQLQARGLALLRESCRYRKFNDTYWWTLGVELRKAGYYEEALETFRAMEKIKRTPSSRKNIQWLERQISGVGDQKSEVGSQLPDLRMKQEKTDLSELLNLMER